VSFILDALKKSEAERQQQTSSEFAGIPTRSPPDAMPRWLWIGGLLLAINLAVLLGLFLRPESTEPARIVYTVPATVLNPAQSEQSFADQVAAAQKNTPPPQAVDEPQIEAAPTNRQVEPMIITQDREAIRSTAIYPSFQEVLARGIVTLPDLHLDIHVYSDAPQDRFVFINMNKYRQGDQLSEGPDVDEITTDGVLLRYQGSAFLLMRD